MSKKTKKNKANNSLRFDYDVKTNLHKLKSGKLNNQTETELSNELLFKSSDDYLLNQSAELSDKNKNNETVSIPENRDNNSNNLMYIKDCISDQGKEYDKKLRSKLDKEDFRWWVGGVTFVLFLISSLIYKFSYAPMCNDVNIVKEKGNDINMKLNTLDTKFQYVEKDVDELKNQMDQIPKDNIENKDINILPQSVKKSNQNPKK
ncbi:MAG: hypothetical protein AB7V07_03200 [Candidatus Delongbacteria bacterium]